MLIGLWLFKATYTVPLKKNDIYLNKTSNKYIIKY